MTAVSYQLAAPRELLHMNTKKLGRITRASHRGIGDRRDSVTGAGWEVAHVAIDDHSRVCFVQIHPDVKKLSAVEFLKAAVTHYYALGVPIKRLITDNGASYCAQLFARTFLALGIKHTFTKPWRPHNCCDVFHRLPLPISTDTAPTHLLITSTYKKSINLEPRTCA